MKKVAERLLRPFSQNFRTFKGWELINIIMEGAGPCERTLTQNLLIRKLIPCGLVSWVARTFLRTLAGFSGGKNGGSKAAELPCPKVKFFLKKTGKIFSY